jgi:hypothetical protein
MAKTKADEYSNVAFGSVTLSAVNTLTFSQIQFAVGLFQGMAIILHRVHWRPGTTFIREIAAATDQCIFAITSTNRLTSIDDISDPSVLAYHKIVGAGANVEPWRLPFITDFTMLPGGGRLIAANPLYLGAVTTGFAAATGPIQVSLDFTFIELAAAQYLEVLQAQFPANI